MPTIGSNLSQYGDVGEYEADRSTWGFADTAFITYTRSAINGFIFSQSCKAQVTTLPGLYPFLDWIPQRFSAVAGKKYRAGAYVTKFGAASNGSVIEIISSSANLTKTSSITKTFGEVEGASTLIESYFTCLVSGTYTIYIRATNVDSLQTLTTNTSLFADAFSVLEWQDDAPPVCTLAFDLPNCIVANETGPSSNDGTITLAVTGAAGPVEYSKDNGATWQSSALFAGLDSGVYQCKARETGNLSCVVSQSFAVNIAAPTFSFTTAKVDESVAGAGDGSITVTVTGTVAPFTFSKDGGTTYQGGNVFAGLTPGTYTVSVKDFNGQILSSNVTIAAGIVLFEKAYFSRDPILYQVVKGSNHALPNYQLYTDVRVEETTGSGSFNSKFKTALEPEADGIARFNLRPGFRFVLKATPPTINKSTIERITDRIKFFKCYSGELFNDLTVPDTLTASNLYLVLLGGLDKKQFPSLNFFSSYLPTNKKFLTWNPLEKFVNRAQEEYLSFLVYGTNISTIKVQVKCFYDDNTNSTFISLTQSGCVKGYLYQIPVGPTHGGVLGHQPAKNLLYYEVQLLNQSDAIVSEKRTYRVNAIDSSLSRYFLYLNSVGGYDTLHTTGQAEVNATIEKSVVQKHLSMSYSSLDGELEVNNSTFQKNGNYSTGYLKGRYAKEYQQSLLDFMNSRRVFEITNGIRVPVIVQKSELRFTEDNSSEYFLRFSLQEAYINHSFTPDQV